MSFFEKITSKYNCQAKIVCNILVSLWSVFTTNTREVIEVGDQFPKFTSVPNARIAFFHYCVLLTSNLQGLYFHWFTENQWFHGFLLVRLLSIRDWLVLNLWIGPGFCYCCLSSYGTGSDSYCWLPRFQYIVCGVLFVFLILLLIQFHFGTISLPNQVEPKALVSNPKLTWT